MIAGVRKGDVQDLLATASGTWVAVTPSTPGAVTLGFAPPGSTTFTPVAVPGDQGGFTDLQLFDGVLSADGETVPAATSASSSPVFNLVRVQAMTATTTPLPVGKFCAYVAASSASDLITVCGEAAGAGSFGSRSLYGSTDAGKTYAPLPNPGEGEGYDTGAVLDLGHSHASSSPAERPEPR